MSEKIIQLNETAIKQELGELVRDSVEKTLNEMLDQEADRLTNARRYERCEDRMDTRAGSYKRKLLTKAGEVTLKVPKLRTLTFETAIIQRYQKREISVEEALVEMYWLVFLSAGSRTSQRRCGAPGYRRGQSAS